MDLPAEIRFGAKPGRKGTRFTVWSAAADQLWVCLFDPETGHEIDRVTMARDSLGIHSVEIPGIGPGALYGLRADGAYAPEDGLWFDPNKLLVDPMAVTLDRPFTYDARLAARREDDIDTAPLMPKAIVPAAARPLKAKPPIFKPGGLIYEIQVRAFTMLHPDLPPALRGTVAALAHPAIIAHLKRIGVNAVELMPITAWIDERHLGPLGLRNSWGYNPVALMALDPRLCPGGIVELRATVAALRKAGIGVILDLVFNHTGESDIHGPTLSLRGLDARAYFRHSADGQLVNDTGCGNTLACDHPATRRLVLDALRHFVSQAGVDGFRFDLAPIMGRSAHGFDPNAALLAEMTTDPLLADRVLIAEPWDIGPGGYQLGQFPTPFLEWNDRARDRIRRFWRGDHHMLGDFITALAGSSDIYAPPVTRSVNFIAAHDGFTLADMVAYAHKHNEANGEHNRDGHNENLSWNNGAEGATEDEDILCARARDLRALLATLFASCGSIMLTAGDEFGRRQNGNNNAYAQDNPISWLDWQARDIELEAYCADLATIRRNHPGLGNPRLLDAGGVRWLTPGGTEMSVDDWHAPEGAAITMLLIEAGAGGLAMLLNRSHAPVRFHLPIDTDLNWMGTSERNVDVAPRSVVFVSESVSGSGSRAKNRDAAPGN